MISMVLLPDYDADKLITQKEITKNYIFRKRSSGGYISGENPGKKNFVADA